MRGDESKCGVTVGCVDSFNVIPGSFSVIPDPDPGSSQTTLPSSRTPLASSWTPIREPVKPPSRHPVVNVKLFISGPRIKCGVTVGCVDSFNVIPGSFSVIPDPDPGSSQTTLPSSRTSIRDPVK